VTATSDVAPDERGLTTNSSPPAKVFRVLKPVGLYVSYEWVTTPLYHAEDPDHVECIHGIEHGDALSGLRRQDEIANITKEVGLEVVKELELELDLAPPSALPWWTPLTMVHIRELETLQVTDALANCSIKCLSGVNGLLLQYTPSPRMQQKDGGSRPPAAPDPQPVIYWAHLQPWATTYSSFMVTGGVASNVLYNLIRTDGGGRLFDSDIALLFQPWLLLGVSNEPFPKSYNGSFINISLPEGVQTAVPHGLLLTIPDYDSPAQLMKPLERNTRSVNAILTIPTGTLFLMCGMHLAFDCELISRYDELWAYWCTKVIADHLGLGVKTGLPYVCHSSASIRFVNLKKEYSDIFWLEELIPFVHSVSHPQEANIAQKRYLELT
jgi:hypothetical protein